jgi:hypothetical protein
MRGTMTVDELNTKMQGTFVAFRKDMDARFAAARKDMDARFAAAGKDMEARFAAADKDMEARFAAARADMDARFAAARKAMDAGFVAVRAEIKVDGETTRRHFEIMVEKMQDAVKVVADGPARNSQRLDNHERRLTSLEKKRR